MTKPRQSAAAPKTGRRLGLARVDEIGDDGLRLRALWNPVPAWTVPIGLAAIAGGIAAVIAAASGSDSNGIVRVLGFAVIGAYAGGAILWSILGAMGGDRLEILFDGDSETASVEQRLLWRWGRNWQFDLDDVERVYVWRKRGRLSFRLNDTHHAAIGFYEGPPLAMGTYHTDQEVMAAALPVGSFVGVPVRRNERPPAAGRSEPE